MAAIEIAVPDLGGFSDVPVIEVLVKPGDTIAKDAPLVTLESDKASMEVPSTAAGTVRDVRVKIGDKVSQGTVLVSLESAAANGAATAEVKERAAATGASAPSAPARSTESVEQALPLTATQATPAAGATTVDLVVPDLGGFSDVPVIEVFIKPGDTIAKDAPLVALESEKATMEVPATAAGTIANVRVKPGDKVSHGTVLATITGAASAPQPAAPAAPASAPEAAPARSTPPASATPQPPPAMNGTPAPPRVPGTPGTAPQVHAGPAIRRFARELGVDLARVRGTGPNARITRDDVQQFVKGALAGGTPSAATSGAGLHVIPWPKVDFAKFGPIERVPLTRIQKLSGPNLARNWVMIPHVTQNDEADVTELEEFRKAINAERKDVKVTMLAFLMKAAVAALKRYPNFNASLDGDELVLKHYYHLGFAADTPNGLVVPVIRDVDRKGVVDVARETAELAAKARDGKLGPAEMSGSTFTISSLGSIGGTTFSPIINAPEVAILGATRAAIRPHWDGSAFVPRLIQPISLSYDHRVIDGAAAARFAAYLAEVLGDLRRSLL